MTSFEKIRQLREFAGGIRAVVIGDAMLDRYIHGTVDRISPEAPVPVLSLQHTETKAGGAANVAANLQAWGCRTRLIGLTGVDPEAGMLRQLLESAGIEDGLVAVSDRPTTVKTRIVASTHHLLRIDAESSAYLTGEQEATVTRQVLEQLAEFKPQLIVLEDYNKGLLTPSLIFAVITWGKAHDCFVAVDPKEKHFFEYRHADLFKPNLREASQAAHTSLLPTDLKGLGRDWRNRLEVRWVAITLGSQGIFIAGPASQSHVLPGRSIDVVDVCGAGDAVIAALALALMAGLPDEIAGTLANAAGAYVCTHSGVVAVAPDALPDWVP